ncbi:hypothetical protein CLOP_g18872 [Closterium sp. NIES-67]|nr:hypothetical protein CLOP_g18872 [Closterium sp. NIES-67]
MIYGGVFRSCFILEVNEVVLDLWLRRSLLSSLGDFMSSHNFPLRSSVDGDSTLILIAFKIVCYLAAMPSTPSMPFFSPSYALLLSSVFCNL